MKTKANEAPRPMTPEAELDELEALAKAARPGPYAVERRDSDKGDVAWCHDHASTVAISGAPVAGANATITRGLALWIESDVTVEISAEQARMMRHAVGQRWHRNHYVAAKGTEADALWMLLSMAGYAREFRDGICMRTWHVTEAGIEALKAFEAKEST